MDRHFRYFLILLISTTLIRIIIGFFLGLGTDESHYFQYAMHLSFSYYDHPPMVGYLIKIFLVIGKKHPFTVRIPAIISGIITIYLLFQISKSFFNSFSGFWACVFFNVIPMFSAIGSITIVPETILATFYLFILFLLWKIYQTKNGYLWYFIGIFTGFSILTKYTGFLLYFSILVLILCIPEMRFWFKKKEIYLSFIISLFFFLPVILWNYENWWVSFGFQLKHGFGNKIVFNHKIFLKNLGGQAGSLSPFLFFFFLFSFLKLTIGILRKNLKDFFLFSFVVPFFLIFCFTSFSNEILPHWYALGYLVLLLKVGNITEEIFSHYKKLKRKVFSSFLIFSVFVGGIMSLIIPLQAFFKILPIPNDVDPTNDLIGWNNVAEEILKIKKQEQKSDFFVFTYKFYLASQLSFYFPQNITVYCLSNRIDQYDFWQYKENLREKLKGRNGIFFCDSHFNISPDKLYVFQKIEKEKPINIVFKNKIIKTYYIYKCYSFDTYKTDGKYLNSLDFIPRSIKKKILLWNEETFLFINKYAKKNKFLDIFFFLIGELGCGYFLVPIIGGIIWVKKKKRFWIYFFVFALILIIGGNIVHFLKEIFHIQRPLLYFENKNEINIIGQRLKSGSFPSGHAQTIFSGVFFLTWFLPKFWYIYWLVGLLGSISRCYVGVHFPIDVIAGFLISFFSFSIVMIFARKVKK